MMSARRAHVLSVALVVLAVAVTPFVIRAQSAAPKPIALEDYPKFKRITGTAISTDGKWMLYTVTPNEGDATLFVKALDGDKVYDVLRGANASFSDNGRWVGYFIEPPATTGRGGRGGARGGSTPAPPAGAAAGSEAAPARRFELLDLSNGTKTTFPSVGSFAFSPDGEWLLIRPQGAQAAPAADAAAGRGGRGGAGAARGPGGTGNGPADAAPRHRHPALHRQGGQLRRSTRPASCWPTPFAAISAWGTASTC